MYLVIRLRRNASKAISMHQAAAGKPDEVAFPGGDEDTEASPADTMMTWENMEDPGCGASASRAPTGGPSTTAAIFHGGAYGGNSAAALAARAQVVRSWARMLESTGTGPVGLAGGQRGGPGGATPSPTLLGPSPADTGADAASSVLRAADYFLETCRRNGTPMDGSLHDFTQAVRNSPGSVGRSLTPATASRLSPATPSQTPPTGSPEPGSHSLGRYSAQKKQLQQSGSKGRSSKRSSGSSRSGGGSEARAAAAAAELRRLTPST